MEFLTPWFWLGAAAVSVPLLLHLVQKEKTRRILFSSLMFVPRLPIKQMQRRKLKHLFLLFLRCLALLLIVIAFARPVVTGAWFNGLSALSSQSLVILIDNSLSMSRPAVWERALQEARERIGDMGEGDEALLMVFAEAGEVASQWENSKETLLQVLESYVRPSFESTSYLEGLRLAVDQFEDRDNTNRKIVLITDLQRSGLSSTQGWKIPPEIRFELLDVGADGSNVHVAEARVEREVYTKDYAQPLLVRLGAQPPRPQQGNAQLMVNGRIVAQQEFQLNEQGTQQLTFEPFELEEGISRGKVIVELEDELPIDNTFNFILERKEPTRILLVSKSQSDSLYLEKALAAGANQPFQIDVLQNLPDTELNPEETPLIILYDLDRAPSAGRIRQYLERGGGVVVTLGRNTRDRSYGKDWEDLLPARIGAKRYVRSKSKPFTSLTEINWEHPVFEVFQDIHRAAVISAQFYVYWEVQPASGSSVLASFDEGHPALVQSSHSRGKILLMSSAPDPLWNDFPLRSAFVPFWYQAARYVAGWQPEAAARRVNQVLNRPDLSEEGQGTWTVLDPTGTRVTSLGETAPGSVQLKMPGFYEIRENKGTDWQAVNTLPRESDLGRIPSEDLLAVFVPQQSSVGESASGDQPVLARERQQSLWWLFLLAAVVVLLVETLVANSQRLQGQQ